MEPVAAIIADPHISMSTLSQASRILIETIDQVSTNDLHDLIIAGDVFDSRKSQTLPVLLAFQRVCDHAAEKKITLHIIPGNHDKLDYTSEESYLDMFAHHSAVNLIRDYKVHEIRGKKFHFIPFFDEKSTYAKYCLLYTSDAADE